MLKKKKFVVGLTVFCLVVFAGFQVGVNACTDIMVGKAATVDGSVITSQTVDGRYDSRIQIIPAQNHESGAMAPVLEHIVYGDRVELTKLGEIPQVPHTYKYFHAAYPFANEHQLIIGESTLGGAKETTNSDEAIMTIEQLQVFALQRTTNARDAIRLIGRLAEKYGYRASCHLGECLNISDPNEVWVFEIYGVGPFWTPDSGKPGAVWAAQRVPDDGVACIPNYSAIGEINPEDIDNFMVCNHYIETAVELGRFDPDSGEPFIWKYVYGDIKGKTSTRLYTVFSALAPSGNWKLEETDSYPFSIKPDKKVSVHDVIALFRDTMGETPYAMGDNESWYYTDNKGEKVKTPLANPQPSADYRRFLGIPGLRNVAVTGCSYYFVSQARSWLPAEIGGLMWLGLDNPLKGVFIPMYTATEEVPESWATVDRDTLDRTCSFWAFDIVDRISSQNYGKLMPLVEEVRDSLQNDMFAMQDAVEKVAQELYGADPELAKAFLTNYTYNLMLRSEKEYYDLGDQLLMALPH